jgi:hypothetical protein
MPETVRYWLCALAGTRSSRFWSNGPFASEAEARAFGEASGRVYVLRQLVAQRGPAHELRLLSPRVWPGHPWARFSSPVVQRGQGSERASS